MNWNLLNFSPTAKPDETPDRSCHGKNYQALNVKLSGQVIKSLTEKIFATNASIIKTQIMKFYDLVCLRNLTLTIEL